MTGFKSSISQLALIFSLVERECRSVCRAPVEATVRIFSLVERECRNISRAPVEAMVTIFSLVERECRNISRAPVGVTVTIFVSSFLSPGCERVRVTVVHCPYQSKATGCRDSGEVVSQ